MIYIEKFLVGEWRMGLEEVSYSTIGKEIYKGLEIRIRCFLDVEELNEECMKERFRIVYIKEGHGILSNGENIQIITSPMVLCLNEHDKIKLEDAVGLKMDVIYFDPSGVYSTITYENFDVWRTTLDKDKYFYRPFLERSDSYICAFSTNHYLGNRISQLIDRVDKELSAQRDYFWPCRSRSYYIELLLLVNSIYDEGNECDKIYIGKMTDEIQDIVNWVHVHYADKIVMEDITKHFNTNKTTLNKKFKEVMGVTVMEYMINLRMQVACSFLRKTTLSIKEIIERAGYRDSSHFMRSFKKYAGCTPSEYREQFDL